MTYASPFSLFVGPVFYLVMVASTLSVPALVEEVGREAISILWQDLKTRHQGMGPDKEGPPKVREELQSADHTGDSDPCERFCKSCELIHALIIPCLVDISTTLLLLFSLWKPLFSCPMNLTTLKPHLSRILHYLSFYGWFVSLNILA